MSQAPPIKTDKPAADFVTNYGGELMRTMEDRLDGYFVEQDEGAPRSYSQYVDCERYIYKVYGFAVVLLDCMSVQHVKDALIEAFERYCEEIRNEQGDVIVWRRRPELSADDSVLNPGTGWDYPISQVKFTFRAHGVPYERYLKSLPPQHGVSPTAGPQQDIKWAVDMMRGGYRVRRLMWSACDSISSCHAPRPYALGSADLLATDWEVA